MNIDFARLRTELPSLEKIIRDSGMVLSKQGAHWFAHCPFHEDSTPSFSIFADGLRCGCPPCQWDGDVFEFVSKYYDLPDSVAAARWLADEYHVEIPEATNGTARRRPDVRRVETPAEPKRKTKRGREVEHYDYTDPNYEPAFRVTRYELLWDDTGEVAPGKTFSQGRIVDGQYQPGMTGVTYWLYRMPAVAAADIVWLCEGERDADALTAAGVVATTDAGGCGAARHFAERGYPAMLRGKDVLIVPDADKVGRERGAVIAHALHGVAARVRIVPLPEPHKDVRDYLEAGGGVLDLIPKAVDYMPRASAEPPPPPRPATVNDNGGDWRRGLLTDKTLNPKPIIANVMTVLRHCPAWQGVLWHNEFSQDAVARAPFPGCEGMAAETVWTDRHDTLLLEWLNHQGISVSIDVVGRAVQAVAEEQKYHPVREFLQDVGSRWDGTERIDTWLQDYLHVGHGHYHYAVGARWLISAVARIFQPGVKADCALILEGEQGIKKSTALNILGEPWFTDQIADLGSKEAAIQTRGVWIIEIAELDSMRRVEVGKVKMFMSSKSDRYRPPYGKRAVDYPRQCVFAGSVNHGTYLHDETGNRRFWPVVCTGEVDTDGLAEVREQLWAEAVVRYRRGDVWHLDTPKLIAEAEREQAARFESDPWEDRISQYIAAKTDVSITQILESCITKPTKDWTQVDKNRVARVLRSLRWLRFRGHDVDGEREWRYRPAGAVRQEEIAW